MATPPYGNVDVFLCYAWEDKAQADSLRQALEATGLRVFQDQTGMRDYDYIPGRIDAALRASRVLLALYTPALLVSEYCRHELHFALLRSYHLDRSRARALAVVQHLGFEDVVPGRLKCWRLPNRDESLDGVAASVRSHVDRLVRCDPRRLGNAPDPLPPTWYPDPPPDSLEMYGRELELWQVHDGLFPDDDRGVGGQVAAITGPGGMGKTLLAQQYARLFAADFPGGVFLLRGFGSSGSYASTGVDGVQRLQDRQLVRLAGQVPVAAIGGGTDAPPADVSPSALRPTEETVARLHRRLSSLEPYLWIVDDVPAGIDRAVFDALRAPTGNGCTLVTARHDLRGWVLPARQVMLGPLGRSASLALLTSRWRADGSGGTEGRLARLRRSRRWYEAARATVDALGAHPLALALAAGLCSSPDDGDLSELAQLVTDPERDALALAEQLHPRLPTDHVAGVAATLLRSITRVPPPGLDVLLLASVLGSQPVPQSLAAVILAEADGLPHAEAGRKAAEGFEVAQARCLAQREETTVGDPAGVEPGWIVHPLVSQTVRRVRLAPVRRQRLRLAAVTALTRELEDARDGNRRELPISLLSHVEHLASTMTDLDEWHLLNEAGRLHAEVGNSRAALDIYRRLHSALVVRLGEGDLSTLAVRLNLAVAHRLHGDHVAARRLQESVHATLSERLGPLHPDTLTAWNDLAATHGACGDHERARDIYRSIHEIRDRTFGPHHPDTLDALTNYAIALGRCGADGEAHRLKKQLYETHRAIYGEGHPRTLDALNNLAATTLRLSDPTSAEAMFRSVHQGRRRLPGPRADTADAAENLAVTVEHPGEAAELLAEAYQIRLRTQGGAHPATERTLRALLTRLLHQNDTTTGPRPGLDRLSRGAEVVEVLPADVVLGEIRLDDERMDDRIELQELAIQVYDTRLAAYGPDDAQTMVAVTYLAHAQAVLDQIDRQVEDAWALIDDATTGLELTLGVDHPVTRAADELRRWISTVGIDDDQRGS